MNELPMEWECWIEENVLRNCAENELIAILINNNFESTLANNSVKKMVVKHRKILELKSVQNAEGKPDKEKSGMILQNKNLKILMEIQRPRITVFENFMSHEECDTLINISKLKLNDSKTVDNNTGDSILHSARTSKGTFFTLGENSLIAMLERRIAELLEFPIEHGEGMQVLNYKIGAEYKAHYDYFPFELSGSAMHLKKGGQRIATLIMYLNDVVEGGETYFPKLTLKIAAKKGSALYFSYFDEGTVDPLTYHGGAPVIQGEKWIATKWIRENRHA